MKCLTPLITHASPSRVARVFIAWLSEPASGSVRQNAPEVSALSQPGTTRSRSSGLSRDSIGVGPSGPLRQATAMKLPVAPATSRRLAWPTKLSPPPPISVGISTL